MSLRIIEASLQNLMLALLWTAILFVMLAVFVYGYLTGAFAPPSQIPDKIPECSSCDGCHPHVEDISGNSAESTVALEWRVTLPRE